MDNNIYSRFHSDISHSSFSEDNNSRESAYGRNHESENYREHWRDSMKKRDRRRFGKKNRYRDRSIPRGCSVDEDDKIFRKERFLPQSIQQSSHFSAYNSNATDHSFLNDNGHTLTAMPIMKDKLSNREHRCDLVQNRDRRPDNERNHYRDRSVLHKRDCSTDEDDKQIRREQLIAKLMELSSSTGYRLNIENCDLAPYASRLHVDYAQTSNDRNDECKQNALQYETPHQQQDYYRQLSSPHQRDLEENRDGECSGDRDRTFLGKKNNFLVEEDIISRIEQPVAQPIQQSSSLLSYNYTASKDSFVDNNRYDLSTTPMFSKGNPSDYDKMIHKEQFHAQFSQVSSSSENKKETPYTDRLHVDYAQATDDKYVYKSKQNALQSQAGYWEQDYYRQPTPPDQRDLVKNRDSEWNPVKDRLFLREKNNSHDEDKIISEEQPPAQPIQQSSSFPTYNYAASNNLFIDNNIHVPSTMPNCNMTPMNTPLNINPLNGTIVSQSNVTVNQNSIMPLSSGPESINTSNSSADNNRQILSKLPNYDMMTPMNTPQDHNPMNSITGSQCFVNVNQNSSIQTSSVDSNRNALSMMPNSNIITSMNINPVNCTTVSQNNAIVNQNSSALSTSSEIVQTSDLSDVVGTGNCPQYGMMASQEKKLFPPVKEVIHLTKSVLYPPWPPNAPSPTTRKKPSGCKVVFVDGLPEKITEEIIREIFERCGIVESVRISKRNFCCIQFSDEISVENAIYFSGYKLKIENKNELPYVGRLYVSYAEAIDDQYDYECKKRALQRQIRHRMYKPLDVHYSDAEASLICERLKNEITFLEATSILIAWLEKGECCKRTFGTFYSMIQSTYNHVRKLQVNKVKCEEQLCEAKKAFKKQLEGSIRQIAEIEKVYKAACLQKCWDHFSKAQRKYIEMWKEQIETLKKVHMEAIINDQDTEECKQTISECLTLYQEWQDNSRSTSLPVVSTTLPVVHYTEYEASLTCEKLKSEKTFSQAIFTLVTWLERGECSEKTSGKFYSMIQITHSNVLRLHVDKVKYEVQLNEVKGKLKIQFEGIIRQVMEIEKIFKAASLQKCWDHFTKTQRKNIEMWKKHTEELKNALVEKVVNEREDEEMDLSDDENDANKKETDVEQLRNHIQKLQEELKHKDSQMSIIQTALQNSEKKILSLIQKQSKDEAELKELRAFKLKMISKQKEDSNLTNDNDTSASSSTINLENEARLFSLMSSLFDVPSFSASMDHICHFLNQIDSPNKARDIENLMKHFLKDFKEKSCDIES